MRTSARVGSLLQVDLSGSGVVAHRQLAGIVTRGGLRCVMRWSSSLCLPASWLIFNSG